MLLSLVVTLHPLESPSREYTRETDKGRCVVTLKNTAYRGVFCKNNYSRVDKIHIWKDLLKE